MPQSRFGLVSRLGVAEGGTRISYGCDARDPWAMKISFGRKGSLGHMLAVRVPKFGQRCQVPQAPASMVVGISFIDGALVVELLNSVHVTQYAIVARDLIGGPAFERFTNRYVEDSARMIIGSSMLPAPLYRMDALSSLYGDSLVLTEKVAHKDSYGRSIVVNLSALFAIGPLTVHHDGKIGYDPDLVSERPFADGELFPFVKFDVPPDDVGEFVARGFDAMTRWMPVLHRLQTCEHEHLEGRGGNHDRATRVFRNLLAELT